MSDIKLDFQDFAPSSSNIEDSSAKPNPSRGRQSGGRSQKPTTILDKVNLSENYQPSTSRSREAQFSGETIRKLIGSTGTFGVNLQPPRNPPNRAEGGWGLGYLAQYFDITTSDVIQRMIWSVVPFRKKEIELDDSLGDDVLFSRLTPETGSNDEAPLAGKQRSYSYIERFIQSRPDLYGPTWISMTLAFAVVVFSNLVSFNTYQSNLASKLNLSNLSDPAVPERLTPEDLDRWHYSLEQLNQATSLVIFHVFILPTILWLLFWFRGCTKYYTITETICAYGYSISVFVPLTALLVYQAIWFRYTLILIASALSGSALTFSFLPIIKTDPNPTSSHLILIIVPLCQLTFAYVLHRIMLQ